MTVLTQADPGTLARVGKALANPTRRRVRYELADRRLAEGLRVLAALDLPGTCRCWPVQAGRPARAAEGRC
jgi:hypothetical protein